MIGTCDVCGAEDVPLVAADWHETGAGRGGRKCANGCECAMCGATDTDLVSADDFSGYEGGMRCADGEGCQNLDCRDEYGEMGPCGDDPRYSKAGVSFDRHYARRNYYEDDDR